MPVLNSSQSHQTSQSAVGTQSVATYKLMPEGSTTNQSAAARKEPVHPHGILMMAIRLRKDRTSIR